MNEVPVKKRRTRTPKENRLIRIYDYEGNFLEDTTLDKAIEITNSSYPSISGIINGFSLHCNGFQFREVTRTMNISKLPSLDDVRPDTTPIAKYWDGRLVCVYNSITEAARLNNTNAGNVASSYKNDANLEINGFVYKKIK